MKFSEPLCNSPIKLDYRYEDLFSARHRQEFIGDRQARRLKEHGESGRDFDVAVIGGGIHGFGLLAQLLARMRNNTKEIRLIENKEYLCSGFLDSIDALRQTVLRSPYEHQLAPDGITQLLDFARLHINSLNIAERRHVQLALASCRSIVPLDVFEGHINHLAKVLAISDYCERDKILAVEPRNGEFLLRTQAGKSFRAERIVFATGAKPRSQRSEHNWDLESWKPQHGKLIVDGGGVTAAHAIVMLAERYDEVEWRIGSDLVFQCSDVPHMYFRTEGLSRFRGLDPAHRQTELRRALRSTVMPEYAVVLRKLAEKGKLRILRRETAIPDQQADRFSSMGYIPDDCIKRVLSVCDSNGDMAINDKTLEVIQIPGAYVSGWAAMSSAGPAAKNIDGVRICAERILAGLGVVEHQSPEFAASETFVKSVPLITGSAPNGPKN